MQKLILLFISFLVTRCLSTWKCWCFPAKMCSDRRKNHGCGQKKTEDTSSGTAAKCCELKRCADRVRSRTDNKDEVLEGKFVTWTFRLPPKRRLSILLNFFFPLTKLFLTFVVFAKTQVSMRFPAKKRNTIQHRVISNVCDLILVSLRCRWTNGQSRDYNVTTKFLGLIGYQFCLAMVLRYNGGFCGMLKY